MLKSIGSAAVVAKRISLFGPPKAKPDAYGVGTGILRTIVALLESLRKKSLTCSRVVKKQIIYRQLYSPWINFHNMAIAVCAGVQITLRVSCESSYQGAWWQIELDHNPLVR